MEKFLDILQQNDEFIRQWGYLALFFAAWFEGFNGMIIGGFIASLGTLNIIGVISVTTLGHALSGFSWYTLGYFGGYKPLQRWGRYVRLNESRLALAQTYFEKHGGKAIFITKFTVGLTIATLVLAGVLKMPLKKFTLFNVAGSIAWSLLTVLFGYTFGLSFKALFQYIQSITRTFAVFLVFLAGAIALWYLLRALFRTQLLRALSENFTSLFRSRKSED